MPTLPVLGDVGEMAAAPCGGSRSGPNCVASLTDIRVGGSPTGALVEPGTEVTFDMRGSAYGEAVAVSPTEMRAEWFSTRLYGTVPHIGPVVFSYRQEKPSSAVIRSPRPAGADFFPAQAEQELYYRVDVLGLDGAITRTFQNREPMRLMAEINSVPPFGVRFESAEDVGFYDVATGRLGFTMREGSPGVVSDPGGLAISVLRPVVDATAGTFAANIRIESDGASPDAVTWFVTPFRGAQVTSSIQQVQVAFAGGTDLLVTASFNPTTDERAGVVVHAFAATGDLAEAHQVIVFSEA